jgi:hypothetical protein
VWVEDRVDPLKPLTEFNILRLKPLGFLTVVIPLGSNRGKVFPKGTDLTVQLLITLPCIITLRGSNPMGITLIGDLMLDFLNLAVTLDQGITQALDNIALAIQDLLGTLKHVLDISVTAIRLVKLMPQITILLLHTTEPIRKLVNPLLQAFDPSSLGRKCGNVIDYLLEELLHGILIHGFVLLGFDRLGIVLHCLVLPCGWKGEAETSPNG